MALKGRPPTAVQKRLKALFFGPPGVGKTTAALQFPSPYLIDTERGAENDQYVRALQKSGGAYMFTTDPDELIEELRSLISEQHSYRTLIIDPLTIIYNDLLDKAADQVGTDFGRHKGPANRKIKHLLSLILRLDMNVIITSHAKAKWVRSKDARGKDTAVQEGVTFDCYDGLDYLFDLVFEVNKRGTERVGIVRKTRIESFPEGEVFPFGYDAIADRYGRELLERAAQAVPLATKEQTDELTGLVADKKDGEAWLAKVLDKAGAETVGELTQEQAEKCIEALRKGKVAA